MWKVPVKYLFLCTPFVVGQVFSPESAKEDFDELVAAKGKTTEPKINPPKTH